MNTLKNIHYLKLNDAELKQLDKAAGLYAANSNITFKILKADESKILAEVRQHKNTKGSYLSRNELVKRLKDLLGHFFPDHTIYARPKPYNPPPVDIVSPEWIQEEMNSWGVNLKTLEKVTGIDKTNLSAYVNGKRPMSQPVQAMFFFMFRKSDQYF